jgi:hypothetical protein
MPPDLKDAHERVMRHWRGLTRSQHKRWTATSLAWRHLWAASMQHHESGMDTALDDYRRARLRFEVGSVATHSNATKGVF